MKTVISASELNDMYFESYKLISMYSSGEGYVERRFSAQIAKDPGMFREISFDGLSIGYGELTLSDHIELHYEKPANIVEMVFILSGKNLVRHDDIRHPFLLQANQHNILFLNRANGRQEWVSDESLKVFGISLTPEFFTNFFPEKSQHLARFLDHIHTERPGILTSHNHVITRSMLNVIHEIMHCDKPVVFRKIFLVSKVMELLVLQLEQMHGDSSTAKRRMSATVKEKLYAVKEFLDKNMEADFSIASLANHYGTNEFTLKQGFKVLFGTSIFDYWNHIRFDCAKRMLKEGSSVQEVANKMGYSSPQNFSTAFKKRFGLIPSVYKTDE